MKRLLIIGCGDVAMRAIPLLVRRYWVFVWYAKPLTARFGYKGIMPLPGDLDDRASLARIGGYGTALRTAPEQRHARYAPPPPVIPLSSDQ